MANVYAIIMAGGSGTRFWPASRQKRPKQLLPLGSSEDALLTATVKRLKPLVSDQNTYVVTGAHLADATSAALPSVPPAQIMLEPAARNTAPCIAWAAATLARRDPEAVAMVLPSDHTVENEDEFRRTLSRAIAIAESGTIATIGIVPTRPETGYGYIELGEPLAGETGSKAARAVKRFVEKPNLEVAEQYVRGKNHVWNAGMFFFRVKDMLTMVQRHLPEVAAGVELLDDAARRGTEATEVAAIFPKLPSISIDHGVMEKAERLAVVPGDFGWNDVGSWTSSWELAPKDDHGNALPDGAVAIEAQGNLVRDLTTSGNKRVYALVGVNDLVLVETDDAVLVIPKDRAQDVRKIIEALSARGSLELL